MTIFAILLPNPTPALAQAIAQKFPNDHLQITDTQWFVSASGTVLDMVTRLGIYDPKNPDTPSIGNAIVLTVVSYHGRAPTVVWEWLKTKMEAGPSG